MKKCMKVCGATDKLKHCRQQKKDNCDSFFLRKILPGIGQPQVDMILLKRSGYAKREMNTDRSKLLSDNLEMGHGCVDESDYDAMKTIITEHKDKLIVARQKLDAERRKRPNMVGFVVSARANDIALAWVREWMPKRGALSKDTSLHWRWKLKYPRPTPPYVYSNVWGDDTEWEFALHDTPCPWGFECQQLRRGG